VLAVALSIPAAASADTFRVTEGSQPSGKGSLRQAIADANAHPGHDTIDFAPEVETIILTAPGQPDIQITDDVDIDGPGAKRLEVFGFSGRAFEVTSSAKVTISGMTISHCGSFEPKAIGGAIDNEGSLTLSGLVMQNNRAVAPSAGHASGGAIDNSGTLTLKDSTLSGNSSATLRAGDAVGGAIANSGTMTVDHVQLVGNAANGGRAAVYQGGDARGGAIANTGVITVVDSTLTQNTAHGGNGPEIGGTALGGAISNYGVGELTVRRSTLDSNLALSQGDHVAGFAEGGGIAQNHPGKFTIENSTITGNVSRTSGQGFEIQSYGGGINNLSRDPYRSTIVSTTIAGNRAFRGANINTDESYPPSLSLRNTIVANGQTPDGRPTDNCAHLNAPSANIDSQGSNLESGNSCSFRAVSDTIDTDPQLKPLADNDGPTPTMAIPLSSPAVDHGVSAGLTTDQRGKARPVIIPGVPKPEGGDGADIGAFELQLAPQGQRKVVGSVHPGRVRVGDRTCFRFEARHGSGDPVRNAQVKFAHKRARTNGRGKATICRKFHHPGVRHPRITKRGLHRDRLRVGVRS
jgi:hypothetical protein